MNQNLRPAACLAGGVDAVERNLATATRWHNLFHSHHPAAWIRCWQSNFMHTWVFGWASLRCCCGCVPPPLPSAAHHTWPLASDTILARHSRIISDDLNISFLNGDLALEDKGFACTVLHYLCLMSHPPLGGWSLLKSGFKEDTWLSFSSQHWEKASSTKNKSVYRGPQQHWKIFVLLCCFL